MSRLQGADMDTLRRALTEQECSMCPVCKQPKNQWVTVHNVFERRYKTAEHLKADKDAVKATLRQVLRSESSEKIFEKNVSLTFDRIRDRFLRLSYLDAEACRTKERESTSAVLPVLREADKELIRRAVIVPGRRHICNACKQATKPWVAVYLILKRTYDTLSNLDADEDAVKAFLCKVLEEQEKSISDKEKAKRSRESDNEEEEEESSSEDGSPTAAGGYGKRRHKKHSALTFDRIRDRFLRQASDEDYAAAGLPLDDSGLKALVAAAAQTEPTNLNLAAAAQTEPTNLKSRKKKSKKK
jgi:RNA polymerase subunit RPABC4/transcription elongation factor Spt4